MTKLDDWRDYEGPLGDGVPLYFGHTQFKLSDWIQSDDCTYIEGGSIPDNAYIEYVPRVKIRS